MPRALNAPAVAGAQCIMSEIPPEVLQAFRPTKERGEIGGIQQHDVSSTLLVRGHPEQTVELSCCRLP